MRAATTASQSASPGAYSAYKSSGDSQSYKSYLRGIGFDVVENICVQGGCLYVLCTTTKGDYVVIDVSDKTGFIPVENTSAYTKSQDFPSTPQSIISGLNDARTLSIDGVAFYQSQNICIVKGQGDESVQEFYVTSDKKTSHPSTSLLGIPVVGWRDVEAHPLIVTTKIHEAVVVFRENSWIIMQKSMRELTSSITTLVETNAVLNKVSVDLETGITRTSTLLDGFHTLYQQNPPETDEEREKYSLVISTLRNRSDMYERLVSISNTLRGFRQMVDGISESQRKLFEDIDQQLESIEVAYR